MAIARLVFPAFNSKSLSEWDRWAVVLWTALVIGVSLRSAATPRTHSVYPIYTQAAIDWVAGQPLYGSGHRDQGLDEFRYPPFFAVALVPFVPLSDSLGSVCWRVLSLAVFLGGFVALSRALAADRWQAGSRHRAILALYLLPLSIASLNNGQANVLMMGLFLLSAKFMLEKRDWPAGLLLAVAASIKVYPLALALLFLLIHPRRLLAPFLAGIALLMAIPWLTQSPSYVLEQYQQWGSGSFGDRRYAGATSQGICDLSALLKSVHLSISASTFSVLQACSGLAVALVVLVRRRLGWEGPRLLRLVIDLGCCWMILLGPATESCTYILLAPTLAWAFGDAWHHVHDGKPQRLVVLSLALGCFLFAMLEKALNLNPGLIAGTTMAKWSPLLLPGGALLLLLERLTPGAFESACTQQAVSNNTPNANRQHAPASEPYASEPYASEPYAPPHRQLPTRTVRV